MGENRLYIASQLDMHALLHMEALNVYIPIGCVAPSGILCTVLIAPLLPGWSQAGEGTRKDHQNFQRDEAYFL